MIRFPFFTMQQLNLDWLMEKIKEILDFMPLEGDAGDVLVRSDDNMSAEWKPFAATELATEVPLMDGTAAVGTSTKAARADHVHPSDTSKQDALTTAQQNAVNSGITYQKVLGYDGLSVTNRSVVPVSNSPVFNDASIKIANMGNLVVYTVEGDIKVDAKTSWAGAPSAGGQVQTQLSSAPLLDSLDGTVVGRLWVTMNSNTPNVEIYAGNNGRYAIGTIVYTVLIT